MDFVHYLQISISTLTLLIVSFRAIKGVYRCGWGIADSAPPLTMQVEQSDPPRCTVYGSEGSGFESLWVRH